MLKMGQWQQQILFKCNLHNLQEKWRRGELETTVKIQPMPLTFLNALFQAMQRPTAIFLPFMGWALSLRAFASMLDVSHVLSACLYT